MAATTFLLPHPKDPLWGILCSWFAMSGEGPVTHRPGGWIQGCCSKAVAPELEGRGLHTQVLFIWDQLMLHGRQSPFRAIKCSWKRLVGWWYHMKPNDQTYAAIDHGGRNCSRWLSELKGLKVPTCFWTARLTDTQSSHGGSQTDEWRGALISTIKGIKTIVKTENPKTNKQNPAGDPPNNIHKRSSRTLSPCAMGIMAPGKQWWHGHRATRYPTEG